MITALVFLIAMATIPMSSSDSMINFGRAAGGVQEWIMISDNVMGGITASNLAYTDSSMVLSGTISLENYGGFASVKTKFGRFDLSEYKGVRIRFIVMPPTNGLRSRSKTVATGRSLISRAISEPRRRTRGQRPLSTSRTSKNIRSASLPAVSSILRNSRASSDSASSQTRRKRVRSLSRLITSSLSNRHPRAPYRITASRNDVTFVCSSTRWRKAACLPSCSSARL